MKATYLILSAALLVPSAAFAADSATSQSEPANALVVITGVEQRPWIVNDDGVLKSETQLMLENRQGQPVEAWVKISVPGKAESLETLGRLSPGSNKRRGPCAGASP